MNKKNHSVRDNPDKVRGEIDIEEIPLPGAEVHALSERFAALARSTTDSSRLSRAAVVLDALASALAASARGDETALRALVKAADPETKSHVDLADSKRVLKLQRYLVGEVEKMLAENRERRRVIEVAVTVVREKTNFHFIDEHTGLDVGDDDIAAMVQAKLPKSSKQPLDARAIVRRVFEYCGLPDKLSDAEHAKASRGRKTD